MSGSGLVDFLVNIVALLAAGAIFFASIDKVAPDAFFAKIAKIAIGALLIIALILTLAGVLGWGGKGVAVSPIGVVWFAVAVIVAVLVLYIINFVVDWIAASMSSPPDGQPASGAPWTTPVKYVLGVLVLIALLVAAANLIFGVKIGGLLPRASYGQLV